jgi:hypothetical protein
MKTLMLTPAEVTRRINAGRVLLLAGDESLLRTLPRGRWIAGTIPYFMAEEGGRFSRELISVVELPELVTEARITAYDENSLSAVYSEAPANGFSVIILPSGSTVHLAFALQAPSFPGFATRPLVGWVSGVALEDLGGVTPKVFDGSNGHVLKQQAVVLHATLPEGKVAGIGIVNLFEPGDGDTIVFPEDGFSAREAWVNGHVVNFAQYVQEQGINVQLPLVADKSGTMINTSFKAVVADAGRVDFFAPVLKDVAYRVARPVGDYVSTFKQRTEDVAGGQLVISCNCILNYLFAELEGKQTGAFQGPVAFGEVAYQLLNQTLVYLTIEDV